MHIRPMEKRDEAQVLEMMAVFYASEAVLSNGSEEIFRRDFENCVSEFPFVQGYVFEQDDALLGYAMVAKSYSTEFGSPCIWIEDLYFREQARGKGYGKRFFRELEQQFPGVVFRLEAEPENERAIGLYRQVGFDVLPYTQFKKLMGGKL